MVRIAWIFGVLGFASLGEATPLLQDGFDHGPWSIALPPYTQEYTPHNEKLGQEFLGSRDVAAARQDTGNTTPGSFVVAEDGGHLSAVATGQTYVMPVTYYALSGGSTDLRGVDSIALTVLSNTVAASLNLEVYSDGYNNFSSSDAVTIPAGYSGTLTIPLSSLVSRTVDPLHLETADYLNVTFNVPSGDSIVLDGLAVNAAVPEPASIATLGLGALALLRRRKRV